MGVSPPLTDTQDMKSIVVLDDRAADRELLGVLLGRAGYSVHEASTGEEALELARAERPDLVITDILMPGMNGYEFVRRLRSQPDTDAIPVIFCTANYVEGEVRRLAAACGVSNFIAKPSDLATVVDMVGEVLGSPGPCRSRSSAASSIVSSCGSSTTSWWRRSPSSSP